MTEPIVSSRSEERERTFSHCVAARLTPPGRAAVAVVGVLGDSATEILRSRWSRADGLPSRSLECAWSPEVSERPVFGLFHFDLRRPEIADEVVLRRRTPTAFELCLHGGELVTDRVLNLFKSRGARVVSGAEWERLASKGETLSTKAKDEDDAPPSSPRLDELFYAPVDELLSETATEETALIACDQRSAWNLWFRAFSARVSEGDEGGALSMLNDVLGASLGLRLTSPFVVALTGVPNVGKSSLLNAVLGYERASTSSVPGTTRDLVGAEFAYRGWLFHLIDAAGLRETNDPLELAGMKLALELASRADAVVCIYDPTQDVDAQNAVFQRIHFKTNENGESTRLNVVNKFDLVDESVPLAPSLAGMLRASALERRGVDELLEALFRKLFEAAGASRFIDGVSDRLSSPLWWTDEQKKFLIHLRECCLAGRFDSIAGLIDG